MILSGDYMRGNFDEGVLKLDLSSWREFSRLVTGRTFSTSQVIWRGQRVAEWLLESTWGRTLKKLDIDGLLPYRHFKYAGRGRGRENPEIMESDDDWWASGQHYGSVTPLLEWTASPFTAAYFAFCKDSDEQDQRAIYSFALRTAKVINSKLKIKNPGIHEDNLLVRFINPAFDNHSGLIKSRGLFTKSPTGVDIEQWVRKNVSLVDDKEIVLVKLTLPNSERTKILKALNRMNINQARLFPDQQQALNYKKRRLMLIKR
ncbi:FRG domain-containing protein [Desulfosporosinus youngiae]|uniref:FRG domain protein n=1 Tax=Desulfosporosinus youngiae DSM 17734 TaxID=768710 RepID=H5Y672_9FIRM|nr:FRG domain-containing protein [Desulfosporosinus youngiae]EHQ91082.1 FRG domain protein [Desulfosporosinus youngiae DSM 17734]